MATLGLTPLTLVFFQQVSLVGFLANLVAIPLVTLVDHAAGAARRRAAPLWSLGARGAGAGRATRLARGMPGAVWTVPAAPLWAQVAGLLAAALLVLPLPWRARLLGAAARARRC